LQCTIEIANGFDAILIENVPQNAQNGPKPLLDTHFRFWSSGFTSNHSFHIAKLITHIVSITVQMQFKPTLYDHVQL
jgi:hypothetical protein